MSRHTLIRTAGGRSEDEIPCKKEQNMMILISMKKMDKEKKRKNAHTFTCMYTYTSVHSHLQSHCWLCHLPVSLYQKNETLIRQKTKI